MSLLVALTLATAGLLGQSAAEPCRAPTLSSTSVDLWITNRVFVSPRPGDVRDALEGGVGLVVGWEPGAPGPAGLAPGPPGATSGKAWVAVPAHVVFGANDLPTTHERLAAQAQVEVRWQRNGDPARFCAGTEPTPPELDVTFLCVEWHGRPLFWQSMEARRITPGMPLALLTPEVAAPIEGRVPPSMTDHASLRAGSRDVIPAEGLFGDPGMSGSPVAAPSGVVGLYQGRGDTPTILSLRAVKRVAAATGVPWSLTAHEFFDCRLTRRVCPT
ncbi:MAG: hypothetical protein KJ061_13465, partial [Vicinamibacteraceae bacterium]|nr:hypothetical protein [Vicinamibacteraceae bacterium]